MSTNLVVAYQTAQSSELRAVLLEIKRLDPTANFVLLVPATRPEHLLRRTEGDGREAAERVAREAAEALSAAGLNVTRTVVGDESPVVAIEEEVRDARVAYDRIILCTFPVGISHWLRLDWPHQVQRRFGAAVTHVVANSAWINQEELQEILSSAADAD